LNVISAVTAIGARVDDRYRLATGDELFDAAYRDPLGNVGGCAASSRQRVERGAARETCRRNW
jgi:hypothetical protein